MAQIEELLEGVTNLDDDRIIRRFLDVVEGTLRTNYFQEAAGGGPVIEAWAFGNEIESVCVNLLNLTARAMTLRLEPGMVQRIGEDKTRPVHEVTTLHRPVWLESIFDETVPDVLPELGPGQLIDLAPGEVQQLWINLHTRDLAPGAHELSWQLSSLS